MFEPFWTLRFTILKIIYFGKVRRGPKKEDIQRQQNVKFAIWIIGNDRSAGLRFLYSRSLHFKHWRPKHNCWSEELSGLLPYCTPWPCHAYHEPLFQFFYGFFFSTILCRHLTINMVFRCANLNTTAISILWNKHKRMYKHTVVGEATKFNFKKFKKLHVCDYSMREHDIGIQKTSTVQKQIPINSSLRLVCECPFLTVYVRCDPGMWQTGTTL